MRVGVIGWGSLIWDPKTLARRSLWHEDGPYLPVEFARVSRDGRLTLVMHPPSADQRTYWVLTACETIEAARLALAEREGSNIHNIGYAARDGAQDDTNGINTVVQRWLQQNAALDAAVWTRLPATLSGPDIVTEAVGYLSGLESRPDVYQRARDYLVKSPSQIQTAVRRKMQSLGWQDEALPRDLFEA